MLRTKTLLAVCGSIVAIALIVLAVRVNMPTVSHVAISLSHSIATDE